MADAKIVSRPATDKYREEYDRIFKKGQGQLQETIPGDNKRPGVSKNVPQYGIVQSYNWRGPKSRATRQVDGDGVDIPESVDNDINRPISEDGSEPSSK